MDLWRKRSSISKFKSYKQINGEEGRFRESPFIEPSCTILACQEGEGVVVTKSCCKKTGEKKNLKKERAPRGRSSYM